MIADTPKPPYYAVIFTSIKEEVTEGYAEMAEHMEALARQQPGFLGLESAREGLGITVSYWNSLEAIQQWKQHAEHRIAQRLGYQEWYKSYRTRVCLVKREYGVDG